MKHVVVAVALFCSLGIPFSIVQSQSLPDGADLFIEAVRYRTGNHTIVHSLSYATEQTYQMPVLSGEEIEREADEIEDQLRRALRDEPNAHLWIDGTREAVRKHHMQTSVISRLTVKYKAPGFSRKLLSLQIERIGQDGAKWETSLNVIESNVISNKSESEGAVFFPQERSAHVNDTQSYMETLLNFGRLQGPPIPLIILMLLQDTDVEKYVFSERNIARFKEERERQIQTGRAKILITVGTATYDGGASAFVVESSNNGEVFERYWIDAARGFVTPLIQYYDADGKLFAEYKSENYFLHEKSGLWFPQLYKEMKTNRDGKQEFNEYRVDKSSVDVNFPIADEEFAIEIPDGATVIDSRRGKGSQRYEAMGNGVLSLGKDGLDLENMDWLWATGKTPTAQTISWWRIVGMVVGVVLVALGLYFHFRQKK